VSPNGAGGLLSRFLEHLKSLRVQSVMVAFAHGFGLQPSCACRRLIVQVGIIKAIGVTSRKKVENHV